MTGGGGGGRGRPQGGGRPRADGSKTAGRAVSEALRGYDAVTLQNILVKIPDRELAFGLAALDGRERERLLALIGPAKGRRVREELAYRERLSVRGERAGRIVVKFLSYFGDGKKDYRDRSYVRPSRNPP